ncbi:hypothetical protein J132_09100 [Termitomyces sp. J132]|nr:hypothetical protein J132_09100 [Termitomyces sp. J132]
MAPNHLIPTVPRKNPASPTAKLPRTPPTTRPSSGQDSPDNFALLQRSVKRDAQQVILAVLQLPLFAQAIIGFCRVTAGIPGTRADHTRYLGTMQLRFADQANFPRIAKQKGLFDSLTATLPSFLTFTDAILQIKKNHHEIQRQREAEVQRQREAEENQDVNMLGPPPIRSGKWRANISLAYKLDLLAHCFDTLSLLLSQTEPDGKPKPKKLKVLPAFSNLKPGSEAMLLLLSQVDTTLETVQLADDDALLPHADLQKYHEAIQLAAQQQLYSLDIALQVYKLISVCLARLDKTLGPSDVKRTRDLLSDLQVLPEIVDFNSDIEITPSSPKNPCPPILVQEATAL